MTDTFPTSYYEENNYLVCPNGDKVRSDAEGLFCWIDGARVPAIAGVGGVITLQQIVEPVAAVPVVVAPSPAPTKTPAPSKSKPKVDVKADPQVDVKVEQTDANG